MNIEEIRSANLRRLIDERFDKKASKLADAISRQSGYVSRVLNAKKGFGEEFARYIETTLGLGRGYLDREDGDDTLTPQEVAAAFEHGSDGKRDALTLLARLPDSEAEAILPLIRSILSKYE